MPDLMDKAQQLEAEHRTRALAAQRRRQVEAPDEDEHGRYCLACGEVIPDERILAEPTAVRCVPCQECKDKQEAIRAGHR